jgi:hypothetical protein
LQPLLDSRRREGITKLNIPQQRLFNQHLTRAAFDKPHEEVAWLVAVQAQDFAGAKWALGLRLRGASDDDVEQAFTNGSILRTHLMRPTWHFVTPADIRWMLALTAPRVNAANAYMYRQLELDQVVFKRSNAALVKTLRGGNQLTREELRGVLQRAGVATEGGLRLAYVIMRAELDGIVCSGPRRGKQFTYMLLDERVPGVRKVERDEALAEFVRRYFLSHGPATVRDFVKWSGLTSADASRGLDAVKSRLEHEFMDGRMYWFSPSATLTEMSSPTAFLLPNYDEYFIGYKDSSEVFEMSNLDKLVLGHIMVIDGRITGTWKRTLTKSSVVIESNSIAPLTKAKKRAIATAARRFGEFLGLRVELA